MDIIDLEKQRISLLQNLELWTSNRIKLFFLFDYFQIILSSNNKNIIEAFLIEFIDRYSYLLANTEPFFVKPKNFLSIIKQANDLSKIDSFENVNKKLKDSIEIISSKFEKLEQTLAGNLENNSEHIIKFPVLENSCNQNILIAGFLETITTSIKKNNESDNFIIIPSGADLEKKLEDQIHISWNIAIKHLRNQKIKTQKFHEVIIQFNHKAGTYTGDSFGTALVLSFIEQLMLLYNSNYLISIKPGIVITGGIDEHQKILPVYEEIIKKKTEILFYSTERMFVVSKNDEHYAYAKYEELKSEYPKRKLKIIGIENIEDLFNRRNIVEIKKQNYFKKSVKDLRNNWKAASVIILLTSVLSFYFIKDYDYNPSILFSSGNTLFVKNKSGKVLWTRKMGYNPRRELTFEYVNYFQKVVDINNDGTNEIILTNEDLSEISNNSNKLRIVCLDKDKNELWQYRFRDTISSGFGKMDTIYSSYLIDTTTVLKRKVLVCFSHNQQSFSSAIYLLDLKTGERLLPTLWHSGFIEDGIIKDIDTDGKKELIMGFINNGYEQVGICSIELEKLAGQCPTTPKYKYTNLALADLEAYILFPKTDYARFINMRIETIDIGGLVDLSYNKTFNTLVYVDYDASFFYQMNYNLRDFEILIGNGYRSMRDSLVVQGKLKPPLTDTEEYCNLLLSQIQYWNGSEFVSKNGL